MEKKLILVVDDEKAMRDGLSQRLREGGFDAVIAAGGRRALEIFKTRQCDLVVLDVDMPVMDGYETCREIRKLDREVPVVFLSGLDREEDQVKGLEAGGDDYVSKSASPVIQLARITAALDRVERMVRVEAPMSMTKTEAGIYRVLRESPGQLKTYREIFDAVLGEGYYADEGAIRSHVSRLREKLPKGETIEAKRGRGFMLSVE